jgi:anti-sigma regulatory factor (Ser/Thr protein kinase)
MEVRLSLSLPRDAATVPMTRRVLDAALALFSVSRDCRADIELAVGEACANAVEHAANGADYHVTVTIQDDRCVIDVIDEGGGVDGADPIDPDVGPDAEAGRGLRIIRALADVVEFRRDRQRGVALRIVKLLRRSGAQPVRHQVS